MSSSWSAHHATTDKRNGTGKAAPGEADGVRVAVTGTSTFDVINPGLGVARALREDPDVSRIYGLSYGTFDSGVYAHGLFDAAFRLPTESGATQLLNRIREIHATHPFDVLIPCLDGELRISSRSRRSSLGSASKRCCPVKRRCDDAAKYAFFDGSTQRRLGLLQHPKERGGQVRPWYGTCASSDGFTRRGQGSHLRVSESRGPRRGSSGLGVLHGAGL